MQQATVLLTARLNPPEMLPTEEQALPLMESAQIIMEGEFGPPQLAEDEEEERELPAFSNLYTASGMAMVYQFPDDRKLLRLEDLRVVNGPDLWIALSTHPAPITFDEIRDNYRDLGQLRTVSGNINFEVPTELTVSLFRSIVIYDRRYRVLFAVAPIG